MATEYTLETREGVLTFGSSAELFTYAGKRGYSLRKLNGKRWRRIYSDDEDAVAWGYKPPAEKKKEYAKNKPTIDKHLPKGGKKMATKQMTLGGEPPKKRKKAASTATKKKGTVKVKVKKAKVKTRAPNQTQHVTDYWRRPPR